MFQFVDNLSLQCAERRCVDNTGLDSSTLKGRSTYDNGKAIIYIYQIRISVYIYKKKENFVQQSLNFFHNRCTKTGSLNYFLVFHRFFVRTSLVVK